MNSYAWEDLALGLSHSFTRQITEEMMEQFLSVSGDSNPLHVDSVFAVDHGFRERVVYGLLSASFYSTLVGVYLPGRYCLLHSLDVAFVAPVYVGDLLTTAGQITHLTAAYRQAQITALINNGNGEKVSKAKIKVGILERTNERR